ncbi:MAG: lactonase family protein [Deltaproteobacteria bacterium]
MSKQLIYVGGYASPEMEGIQLFTLDLTSGQLNYVKGVRGIENPSFLILTKDFQRLYAVVEVSEHQGNSGGGVAGYAISEEGRTLNPLNNQPTNGNHPCHLSLSHSEDALFVANYSGGSVAAYQVMKDGNLSGPNDFHQHHGSSVNLKRQEGPHAHMAHLTPDGRHLLVTDLGTDQLMVYQINSQGKLDLIKDRCLKLPAGSGPRHLTFSHSNKSMYLINELGNTILVFPVGEDGLPAKEPTQEIKTLPGDFSEESTTADIHVHPNGKFLYGTNRGHDSFCCYRILPDERLELIGHVPTGGQSPRNFSIHPDGKWLVVAHQVSGNILSFAVDQETGMLKQSDDQKLNLQPSCVQFGHPSH